MPTIFLHLGKFQPAKVGKFQPAVTGEYSTGVDMAEGKEGYFIISCMDRDEAFAMPYSWIQQNKNNSNVTDRGDRSYWHVPITLDSGKLAINTSKVGTKT